MNVWTAIKLNELREKERKIKEWRMKKIVEKRTCNKLI